MTVNTIRQPEAVRADRLGGLAAGGAALVGLLYAAISAYWALGGTALLDTVGGSLERDTRSAGPAIIAGLWAIVLLKIVAAALPWVIVRGRLTGPKLRLAAILVRIEVAVLSLYGAVLTAIGLLVEVDVLHAGAHADRRALAWHAFLWDPWFLVWGVLGWAALRSARQRSQ